MALTPISIQPLQERLPIVDVERRPVPAFIRALNAAFRLITSTLNEQGDILNRLAIAEGLIDDQGNLIAAQQLQIDDLTTSQEESASAISLQNSGVVNEIGPLTCTASGLVTIEDHSRMYGNPTLNPTVAVTGNTLSTGEGPGTVIYIYYDDPMRAGGTVTYFNTTDNADVAQIGDRHSVGYVEVPPSGTADGQYTRPR